MAPKNKIKRQKDGSYILSSKAKETKNGDCIDCGENSKTRELLFQYKAADMLLVKNYMEEQLSRYTTFSSIKPIWCNTCKALLRYVVNKDDKKSN